MNSLTRFLIGSMSLLAGVLQWGTSPANTLFAAEPAPVEIGSRLELFVDDLLIDRLIGQAKRQLQMPTPQEVVLTGDQPWEGNTCAYFTVFRDDDRYRMYYRGLNFDHQKRATTHREVTCYAESTDGIRWTKPPLGIFEFNGSKENSIVWDGRGVEGLSPGSHNFTPFKDANPRAAPDARYKALASGGKGGLTLYALKSADGIHWAVLSDKPVITRGTFDSQNLAFWDAQVGKYREYHRAPRGVRDIMTCTSDDFLSWTQPEFLEYPGAPPEDLYTNAIRPYERAPHLLLGFPTRYLRKTEQTEPIFMTSRDGRTFHRWPDAVIPRTAPKDRDGNRSNYMAWGLVRLPGRDNELSVYAKEAYYTSDAVRIRRFTYRLDGFVSIHAPEQGGELVTHPFKYSGDRLVLNFVTGAQGRVRVELQDAGGKPLEGLSLDDCRPVQGDATAQVVSWNAGADVRRWAGRPVRLRFALKEADLFSFQFANK